MKTAQRESHRRWARAFQEARVKWKREHPQEAYEKRYANLTDSAIRAANRRDRETLREIRAEKKWARALARRTERVRPEVVVKGYAKRPPKKTFISRVLSVFHRQKLRRATP